MSKKGFIGGMGMGGSGSILKIISGILGLIVLAMGLIPLLNSLGWISFTFGGVSGIILDILLVVVGLMLIIDCFKIQSF